MSKLAVSPTIAKPMLCAVKFQKRNETYRFIKRQKSELYD